MHVYTGRHSCHRPAAAVQSHVHGLGEGATAWGISLALGPCSRKHVWSPVTTDRSTHTHIHSAHIVDPTDPPPPPHACVCCVSRTHVCRVLRNGAPSLISGLPASWSSFFRTLALAAIFLRSGLELDLKVCEQEGGGGGGG
jgi:hypothetical protein